MPAQPQASDHTDRSSVALGLVYRRSGSAWMPGRADAILLDVRILLNVRK